MGGATALFASVVLLTQPTVKVALGYSSAAHMGFMLLVCGIGIYPAAFLHLVAHSFYKAHAFLSSGSVIDEVRSGKVSLASRTNAPGRLAASVLVAAALYGGFALGWGIDLLREPGLAALGAILVLGLVLLLAPAVDARSGAAVPRVALLALGVTTSFFVLEGGTHHLLHGVVPDPVDRAGIQLALVAMVLVAFAVAVAMQVVEPARPGSRRRQRLAIHFRNGLYANAALDRMVGALRPPSADRGRAADRPLAPYATTAQES
jgi:NAD(P)H-quinone oxidoreductase subunit 5